MLKIIRNISASWNELTEMTLRRSWGKIFPIESHSENTEFGTSSEIQHTVDNDDFVTLFNIVGQDINETEISEWLETDVTDKGYAHLTDQEIIKKVTNHNDSESEVDEDITTDLELDSVPVCTTLVSNSDAMTMFDGCITWLHQQKEANAYNLSIFHEIRELAAKKRLSNLNQIQLDSFLLNYTFIHVS